MENEPLVGIAEFNEWKSFLSDDDLINAFTAIKTLELMNFKQTIGEDFMEVFESWKNYK